MFYLSKPQSLPLQTKTCPPPPISSQNHCSAQKVKWKLSNVGASCMLIAKNALPFAQLMPATPESRELLDDRVGHAESPGADGTLCIIRGRELTPKGGPQLCSRDPS